ncbi:hypothetical protein PN459_21560 [Microcystis aeruginosa CS-567/02-A1]|uniref:hypothetical protein n=1 Tax=Microcystis aeruginosa TaxID=1126 RepID=UPI002330BE9E|nr:hypothetical protein [Microcystis aeruginosa]MDB9402542.1 hypothetical protein [Microcystis aeruginosa CS-567/02-A1]
MTTLALSTPATTAKVSNDYAAGYFDAATHAAPKTTSGQYYEGYLDYTRQSGKPPF